MTDEPTLEFAREQDRLDPLRDFRDRFWMPRGKDGLPVIYLCGHSLGLQPVGVREVVDQELDSWAQLAVLGHEHGRRPWIPYHEYLTAGLAELTGARPNEVVAMNSLTVNIHMMLASFYRPSGSRTRILIEAGAFSSDRHAVASQIAWHGLDPRRELIELAPIEHNSIVSEAAIEECLARHGAEIALVLWPGVQFRSGQAFDLPRLTRAAHRAGSVIGFDLAHSVGNVPLALHDTDADFAVWCGYKYLNGGPGCIGGAFIHEKHLADGKGPALRGADRPHPAHLAGWWGHEIATRFRMEPDFHPEPGAAGWQVSNPPILSAAPLIVSLDLFQEAGLGRLRAKSLQLTGYLESLVQRLGQDVSILTPSAVESRGCQLSIRISGARGRGRKVFERLGQRNVICDWREPDVIRVAPVPFYNSFEDVLAFSDHLTQALREIP